MSRKTGDNNYNAFEISLVASINRLKTRCRQLRLRLREIEQENDSEEKGPG